MAWQIIIYETPSGQSLIERFIRNLQPPTQAKLIRLFSLLEEFGPDLKMPHTKTLNKGLFELRVRGRQEIRIFYIFATHNRIYLLHTFQKQSQATPRNELNIARQRQRELVDQIIAYKL